MSDNQGEFSKSCHFQMMCICYVEMGVQQGRGMPPPSLPPLHPLSEVAPTHAWGNRDTLRPKRVMQTNMACQFTAIVTICKPSHLQF